MATRRTLKNVPARIGDRSGFSLIRYLACESSIREAGALPLRDAEREAYEDFKRRGGTLHLYNKAAR